MIKGVFLYYNETPRINEIQAFLQERELDINMVRTTPETVSNLVPYALQRDCNSWLILFKPDYEPQDLAILPFYLDENGYQSLLETLTKIDQLLEKNRHNRLHPFAYLRPSVYRNLRRFEQLRIDVPLDYLLDPDRRPQPERPDRRPQPERSEALQRTLLSFEQTSQDIQEKRTAALIQAGKMGERDLSSFDDELSEEGDRLLKTISGSGLGFKEVVPEIVTVFDDIMDPITKRFLITAETVGKFAKTHSPSNFDYSAPGCGLWKAVERELNLSLILHLRRSGEVVANVNHPWQKNASAERILHILIGRNASVDISDHSKNHLKGIMLGNLRSICSWRHCNTVREKLENLSTVPKALVSLPNDFLNSFPDDLNDDLSKIILLRNGHAHISAMSESKFNDLRTLVLPTKQNKSTCLVKILQLKKAVFEYWRSDSPTYITTEDGKCVNFSPYNKTEVIGSKERGWKLVATHWDSSQLYIATFHDEDEANDVREELDKAVGTSPEWDVRPIKRAIGSKKRGWKLVVTHEDGSQLCIATFRNKDKADKALKALPEVVGTSQKWDVRPIEK